MPFAFPQFSVRTKLWLFILIFSGSITIYNNLTLRNEQAKYRPPGAFMHLSDGQDVHFVCRGENRDKQVFIVGGVDSHTVVFNPLMEELERFARVCTFDRPGSGWSFLQEQQTNMYYDQMIAELAEVVDKTRVSDAKEFYMIGHGFGIDLIFDYYDRMRPRNLKGILCLNPYYKEDMNEWLSMWKMYSWVLPAFKFVAEGGISRFLWYVRGKGPVDEAWYLPEKEQNHMIHLASRKNGIYAGKIIETNLFLANSDRTKFQKYLNKLNTVRIVVTPHYHHDFTWDANLDWQSNSELLVQKFPSISTLASDCKGHLQLISKNSTFLVDLMRKNYGWLK